MITPRRGTIEAKKGYLFEYFQEAFSRYLSPIQTVTTPQQRENNYLMQFQTVTQKNHVTDENSPNSLKLRACDSVMDRNTPAGREDKKEVLI